MMGWRESASHAMSAGFRLTGAYEGRRRRAQDAAADGFNQDVGLQPASFSSSSGGTPLRRLHRWLRGMLPPQAASTTRTSQPSF